MSANYPRMISDLYPEPSEFRWKELYRAALFELNPAKIEEHIAHAEWAIVLRDRQLFAAAGDHVSRERKDLNAALHALRALKDCVFPRSVTSNTSSAA